MPYKIVGADENSDFPPRVEARLKEKFTEPSELTASQNAAINAAKTYTDNAISGIDTGGLTEDPTDPGFFI